MKNINSSHQKQLKQTAQHLINQGFSVIPVEGNRSLHNPKKPATQWKAFQKRCASIPELNLWFEQNITAIGIVCGKISNLMVIDFDDHLTYSTFCKTYPFYADTYTVKTKRGYHLYYKIDQHIHTQKFEGGDIKGEKSYVIAPPSIVDKHQYQVTQQVPYKELLPTQVDEIFNHLQLTDIVFVKQNHQTKSSLDLKQVYDSLKNDLGRNNALYRTASIARNNHISQDKTEVELIFHHVTQPPPANHKAESQKDRYLEAERTINSAYQSTEIRYPTSNGTPNSIREALLQKQNSTVVPRLLDVFHLAKWKSNKEFTMSDAIQLCKNYGLNRKSVMDALTGSLAIFNGQHIIIRSNVEYPDIEGLNICKRGRRSQLRFYVPSIDDLLKVLNVSWSPSDKITSNDIKSAHTYRLALHREYIKRLSPQVPMGWLAERIGVNVRTIQRYNCELNVQKTQNLAHFTLSKSNLDSLPKRHHKITKNATNGFWLETEDGKRYPAWRHIGGQLLKLHPQSVKLCVQKPSKLMLSDNYIEAESIAWHPITPAEFIRLQAFRECIEDRPTLTQVVDNLFSHVKSRLKRVRYFNMQLHFDSVISHIAKDDVAETITSYLFAYDDEGERVMRPAKRGIAYRMLKEFGDGNVYLALLDIQTEMWYSLARHAMRFGYPSAAMKYLLTALD